MVALVVRDYLQKRTVSHNNKTGLSLTHQEGKIAADVEPFAMEMKAYTKPHSHSHARHLQRRLISSPLCINCSVMVVSLSLLVLPKGYGKPQRLTYLIK